MVLAELVSVRALKCPCSSFAVLPPDPVNVLELQNSGFTCNEINSLVASSRKSSEVAASCVYALHAGLLRRVC